MTELPITLKNQLVKIKKKTNEIWLSYKVLHTEDDVIYIFVPKFKNTDAELEPGEEIQVICTGNESRVMFDSVVRSVRGNIVSVPYQKQSMEIQERKYVRVDVNIPAIFTRILDDGSPSDYHRGIICDLSEGGAKITTSTFLNTETELRLKISIPQDTGVALEEEYLTCRVMHYKIIQQGKYEAGIKFVGIFAEQRQRILRFVFNKLLEQKKTFEIQEFVNYFQLANH